MRRNQSKLKKKSVAPRIQACNLRLVCSLNASKCVMSAYECMRGDAEHPWNSI